MSVRLLSVVGAVVLCICENPASLPKYIPADIPHTQTHTHIHYITLLTTNIAIHCITWPYSTSVHHTTLPCLTLNVTALHCTTWLDIALRYSTIYWVAKTKHICTCVHTETYIQMYVSVQHTHLHLCIYKQLCIRACVCARAACVMLILALSPFGVCSVCCC